MRFGWLAAAAVMVMGAGQAQAARYFEIKLVGSADRLGVYDADGKGFRDYNYLDTLTFTFDAQNLPASTTNIIPTYFDGAVSRPSYNVGVSLTALTTTSVAYFQSLNAGPGGPVFNFSFALPDVPVGPDLRPVATSNSSFAYNVVVDPRGPTAYQTNRGQIVSFSARTSDVAPASLGLTETFVVSVLPEPASWAMMIVGVGMIGGTMRRRRPVFASA